MKSGKSPPSVGMAGDASGEFTMEKEIPKLVMFRHHEEIPRAAEQQNQEEKSNGAESREEIPTPRDQKGESQRPERHESRRGFGPPAERPEKGTRDPPEPAMPFSRCRLECATGSERDQSAQQHVGREQVSECPELKGGGGHQHRPPGGSGTVEPSRDQHHSRQGEKTSEKGGKPGAEFTAPKREETAPSQPVDEGRFVIVTDIAEHRFLPIVFIKFGPFRRHVGVAAFIRFQKTMIAESDQVQKSHEDGEANPGISIGKGRLGEIGQVTRVEWVGRCRDGGRTGSEERESLRGERTSFRDDSLGAMPREVQVSVFPPPDHTQIRTSQTLLKSVNRLKIPVY